METRELPQTLADWVEFMNGYRDPKSREEAKRVRDVGDKSLTGIPLDYLTPQGGGSGARECGSRKEGGTYATCPLSADGKPLEHFIVCKPVPIVADDYNLSNVGVKLVDLEEVCLTCKGVSAPKGKGKYVTPCSACDGTGTETVTHVFDIVGQEYYPNIADFLEEARRLGVSRRMELEDGRQYARLSTRSRLMLLHHRAVFNSPAAVFGGMGYTEELRFARASCPKGLTEHDLTPWLAGMAAKGNRIGTAPGCSALYWNVLEDAILPIPEDQVPYIVGKKDPMPTPDNRFVERRLVSGTYRGYRFPPELRPDYALGIFAVFPLVKIDVVDPEGVYEGRVKRAGNARLDVEAVEC